MRRSRRRHPSGFGFVCFGLGLLACVALPTRLMVVLLGAALILCGFSCGK